MRLQFIFNNKQVKITTVLFKNITPILNIDKIVYFKETNLSGKWLKQEFRYSFDNVIWSNWNTLTQQALINLSFLNKPKFYLEILYTRNSFNTADIKDFYLFYDSNSATKAEPIAALPYSNLEVYNTPTDSSVIPNSAGIYDKNSRIDGPNGSSLFFKRLVGVDGIIIRDTSNGTIEIDASGITGSGYQNPAPVNKTVGGIIKDEEFFLDTKTFADTMHKMFYPVLYPTLTPPSNTINIGSTNNLQVINSSININFNSAFNRGSISPVYTTSGFRSGLPNNYVYLGAQIAGAYPSNLLTDTQSVTNYTIIKGVQNWSSQVYYNLGEQPIDSEGHPYDSALPAGNTGAQNITIEGVYGLYVTTSDITLETPLPLYSMITGNNIVIELASEAGPIYKQTFEIPDEWLLSRPLTGIQTFNTVSNTWQSTPISEWNTFSIIKIINSNNVFYTKYIYNKSDRAEVSIKLIF